MAVYTVNAENVEMDFLRFGHGKRAFVILPGLSVHSVTGAAEAVEAAFRDFTEEWTVYLFDRAKTLREGCTVRSMAEDTAKAMRALGITQADVFGASQGGMIAQYLAIDAPELVHRMILGSTQPGMNPVFEAVVDRWLALAEARDEAGLLAFFVDTVYSAATLKAYRDVMIAANAGITEEEYRRFLILTQSFRTFDCSGELSAIQCPVLVLGSEGDRVMSAAGSVRIAEALGCEMYLYPADYGHAVYDEAPDYRQRCLDFLRKDIAGK